MAQSHGALCLTVYFLHVSVVLATSSSSCEGDLRSSASTSNDTGVGLSVLQSNRDIEVLLIGVQERQNAWLATRAWDIIEEGGVKFSDVAQGEIGTCYFLASLASIAMTRPEVIDEMFIRRELWVGKHPAYTTRWLLNGKPALIAVDDLIPVNTRTGNPAFVHFNDGADFWPVVLEKTWAKIFGSYKRVDGGTMAEAYKAITQAPVEMHTHTATLDTSKLWNVMMEASTAGFPLGCGSRANSVSIPYPHAFAIARVEVLPKYGKSVFLYNPWAKDRYTGEIPNEEHNDGRFHMTFEEYVTAFHHTTIAKVRKGYMLSSIVLSKSEHITTEAIEFEMSGGEPFSVQVEWPSERFVPDCRVLEPHFTMAVSRKDTPTDVVHAAKSSPRMSNARADLPGGSGTYQVFISAEFGKGPWLKEIVINTYAAEKTKFVSVNASLNRTKPIDVFLGMHNMCDVITVRGMGEYEIKNDELMGGVPTFWAKDRNALKQVIFWSPIVQEHHGARYYSISGDNTWKITMNMDTARKRTFYPGFNAEADVSCAIASAPGVASLGVLQATSNVAMHLVDSHVTIDFHDGADGESSLASEDEEKPSLKCERIIERLHDLDNAQEIKMGSDSLFPPEVSSIGAPDDNCGDAASKQFESCSKYDHWDSFGHIMKGEAFDPHCTDNRTFVDSGGYRCSEWAGYNCTSRYVDYSMDQMRVLRGNCPRSCRLCTVQQLERLAQEVTFAPIDDIPDAGRVSKTWFREKGNLDATGSKSKSVPLCVRHAPLLLCFIISWTASLV